jgi:hypothetical protein
LATSVLVESRSPAKVSAFSLRGLVGNLRLLCAQLFSDTEFAFSEQSHRRFVILVPGGEA